jgi:hypothetical protein
MALRVLLAVAAVVALVGVAALVVDDDRAAPGADVPAFDRPDNRAERISNSRRIGLTKVRDGILAYGEGPRAEAALERIERQLARLGGPLYKPADARRMAE